MPAAIAQIIAGVLCGAVITHADSYSAEFTDAMRQLHWTIHDVESRFTRADGPVTRAWMAYGYSHAYRLPVY